MAIYPFQNVRIFSTYRFHNKVFNAGKPALLTLSARGTAGYIQQAIPHPLKVCFSFVFFQHHCVTTALFNAVVTLIKQARAEPVMAVARSRLF